MLNKFLFISLMAFSTFTGLQADCCKGGCCKPRKDKKHLDVQPGLFTCDNEEKNCWKEMDQANQAEPALIACDDCRR